MKSEITYAEIVEIRKGLGLNVEAFCELIGIKKQTYYTYKAQRTPKGSLIKLLTLLKDHPEETYFRLRGIRDVK